MYYLTAPLCTVHTMTRVSAGDMWLWAYMADTAVWPRAPVLVGIITQRSERVRLSHITIRASHAPLYIHPQRVTMAHLAALRMAEHPHHGDEDGALGCLLHYTVVGQRA